jgi:purine nucleoside permease
MRTLLFALAVAAAPLLDASPVQVKVVVVTMFEPGEDTGDRPGEFQFWVEREGFTRTWEFPAGERTIRSNADGSVLAVVTGIGTIRAAATITALGHDPRFDFSKAYWLVAGIAGVDPHDAPLGSAVWADHVVDGDLSHEIDTREVPAGWPTGYLPLRKKVPYEQPANPDECLVFTLDRKLVDWAFNLTKGLDLPDTEPMQRRRALYEGFPNAQRPPLVLRGDNLSSSTYWHGVLLNKWANDWVAYFTGGAGSYVTTAMEDSGTLHALHKLGAAGRVDPSRALVLRTASNFDMQWPGGDAAGSLSGEKLGAGYSAYVPSLDAAHRVGSKVVHALLKDWEKYAVTPPGR